MKNYLLLLPLVLLTACSTFTGTRSSPSSSTTASTTAPTTTTGAPVAYNPTASEQNVTLGMTYLKQGNIQQAKQKLSLALQQNPSSPTAQSAMGYFLENTGEANQASQYYQRSVSLDQKNGAAQNNYGAYLCKQKRYQEADQYFMMAAQNPNYLNTASAYENAGLCAMQIPNMNKAMAYFQKAAQSDPNRSTSYLELAQISYSQSKFQQAQQYFDRYSTLSPPNQMGPNGLWLGVRLARQFGDTSTAGQYALYLQNKYPRSSEASYLRSARPKKNENTSASNTSG